MKEYSLEITYKERSHNGEGLWAYAIANGPAAVVSPGFGLSSPDKIITRKVSVADNSRHSLTEKQFLHDVSYQFTKKFLREKGKLTGKIINIKILDEWEY